MSPQQFSQPFRFMDLPGEIRNSIYDLLFCSWDEDLEQDQDCDGILNRRVLTYPAAALMRASKQLHSEASHYMVKRNQFVHVTCRGFEIRHLFLHEIPVVTSNRRKTNLFKQYAMHLTLTKPMLLSTSFEPHEYSLMVLYADLPLLCEKLDIESAMMGVNVRADRHTSVRIKIDFNHTYAQVSTSKFQEQLLHPIATFLRGISKLSVRGAVDPVVVENLIKEVAKPRWTDPDATLREIRTGVDVGKRQWQQNNYIDASESWSYAMRTLERMRHSSSWIGLEKTGGEDFVNSTADLHFELNFLSAQFLQVDMENQSELTAIRRSGKAALRHLHKCALTSALFALHAGATWTANNRQRAETMYRLAKCLRLMKVSSNGSRALDYIEQAVSLFPADSTFEDEKDKVSQWNTSIQADILMARRLEDAREDARTQRQGILSAAWSYLVSGIFELAA